MKNKGHMQFRPLGVNFVLAKKIVAKKKAVSTMKDEPILTIKSILKKHFKSR